MFETLSYAIPAILAIMPGLAQETAVRAHPVRHVTLQEVKQSADRAASPMLRLNQLSLEVAKQHRLAAEADYLPKISASFANLHYTESLGTLVTIRRPVLGIPVQVPVAIFNQNQTMAAVSVVQPLTPLFEVREAVRVARADERIAAAKAGMAIAKNGRDARVEDAYFKLLIAQLRLISADSSRQERDKAAADVRELTATLNKEAGWPDNTELELTAPEPLVENITLEYVAQKSVASNPEVIEAQQNVVKAKAAATLSKLAYVPTIALTGGYVFQNVIPAVTSNFGYGGVVASYNLFDFGKRERGVKAAHAQVEMAELALELTKAKASAELRKSYMELERSRQLSNVALKMGSSMAVVIKASTATESTELKAARAEVEIEMLEADLAHRQAFARLTALVDRKR